MALPLGTARVFRSEANHRIYDESLAEPKLRGMGTTMVAALVRDGQAWLANVGDSRAYIVRGAQAEALTQDHSLVAHQLRIGMITDEEARASGSKNVITRSLGVEPSVRADLYGPIALRGGHALLLCSDGLYGVVAEAEIGSTVAGASAQDASRRLVDLANRRGGPDNVTVVAMRTPASIDDTVYVRPGHRRWRSIFILAAALAGAAALAFALAGQCTDRGNLSVPAMSLMMALLHAAPAGA